MRLPADSSPSRFFLPLLINSQCYLFDGYREIGLSNDRIPTASGGIGTASSQTSFQKGPGTIAGIGGRDWHILQAQKLEPVAAIRVRSETTPSCFLALPPVLPAAGVVPRSMAWQTA